VLVISFLIWKIVNSPNLTMTIEKIMEPFIWAALIAFVLNSLLNVLERHFKLRRSINISIVYLVFYGTIVLILTIITPRLIDNMKNLAREIPNYARQTQRWLSQTPIYMEQADKYGVFSYIRSSIDELFLKFGESVGLIISEAINRLISLTSNFINFILGSIISIYILKDKEYFAYNLNRLTYAIFPNSIADPICDVIGEIRRTFSNFLVGKLLDSLIIGILCFIGCLILRVKYALLISLVVGITNMIPYFGPFIGMVPAAIITLFQSPFKALWVTIFIFLLQQFDGLYLGPKILGVQVGLRPFWIIVSILIGGGFFGVWGMLFAVPVAAVIRTLLDRYIDKRLDKKEIEIDR